MAENREAAVQFLEMVVSGRIDEAYDKFVDMNGKHHNAYTPAGFPELKKGMIENHAKFPNKKFDIKRVICEGDLVATHSHLILKPGEIEIAVVHIFRFKGGKIIELWDCGLQIPADSPNKDGLF